MIKMKYVLDEESLRFVLIPESMNHSDVSGYWTSAGFVNIVSDENNHLQVSCYGKSVSLGLSSVERDATIIRSSLSSGL